MNKRQKQVIQSQLNDEKATLNKLKGVYKKALDDVNDRLAALKGRAETENLQSVIYQIQYQEALKKQINGILDTLNGDQFSTISEYLAKSYESGFVGAMYDIHGQGVPLIFPIDQDQVVQAVTLDTKLSKPLYNKLGENVNLLKKRVANNISRGIAQGQSYSDIAKNIAVGMVGNYARMNGGALYNAMRITRTEAHRISQQAAYDALKKAKDNGADVVKQWDATLDKRTRPSHARVDGEIRELDEPFSNGLMKPGDPRGRAAEVINCRCQLLQRAKCALDEDELDELKERAAYFGLDKTANFEEFRRKYIPASIANSENSGIINAASQPNYYDRVVPNPGAKFKVKIDGYDNFVNNGLSEACKTVADEGFKNDCEILRLVNLDTGAIEYEEIGTSESVGNESFWKFASQNSKKRYAFVHNHNTMSSFSETDMRTLLSDNCVDMFVVSRADGIIMIVEKNKTPETLFFDKLYADKLEQINKKSRAGEISPGDRTFLREKTIVDNLIKEYTKGLIIFE